MPLSPLLSRLPALHHPVSWRFAGFHQVCCVAKSGRKQREDEQKTQLASAMLSKAAKMPSSGSCISCSLERPADSVESCIQRYLQYTHVGDDHTLYRKSWDMCLSLTSYIHIFGDNRLNNIWQLCPIWIATTWSQTLCRPSSWRFMF